MRVAITILVGCAVLLGGPKAWAQECAGGGVFAVIDASDHVPEPPACSVSGASCTVFQELATIVTSADGTQVAGDLNVLFHTGTQYVRVRRLFTWSPPNTLSFVDDLLPGGLPAACSIVAVTNSGDIGANCADGTGTFRAMRFVPGSGWYGPLVGLAVANYSEASLADMSADGEWMIGAQTYQQGFPDGRTPLWHWDASTNPPTATLYNRTVGTMVGHSLSGDGSSALLFHVATPYPHVVPVPTGSARQVGPGSYPQMAKDLSMYGDFALTYAYTDDGTTRIYDLSVPVPQLLVSLDSGTFQAFLGSVINEDASLVYGQLTDPGVQVAGVWDVSLGTQRLDAFLGEAGLDLQGVVPTDVTSIDATGLAVIAGRVAGRAFVAMTSNEGGGTDLEDPMLTLADGASFLLAVDDQCEVVVGDHTGKIDVTDDCSTDLVVSQDPAPDALLSTLGPHAIQFSATDDAGHTGTLDHELTVLDTIDPTATCPSNVVVDTDPGVCTASVDFLVAFDDNCGIQDDGCTAASGDAFPEGGSVVDCWAIDTSANEADCAFEIAVIDNEAPVLACPVEVIVPNDPDTCGAVVTFEPTATDNCAVTDPVVCDTPSGSDFPVYPDGAASTIVTCTVDDINGNTGSCSFEVTVQDTQAPTVHLALSPEELRPPNRSIVPVSQTVEPADNCPTLDFVTSVASSEPDGSGAHTGDVNGTAAYPDAIEVGTGAGPATITVALRAETHAKGNGKGPNSTGAACRYYTFDTVVTDGAGNQAVASAVVSVPSNSSADCGI